jgi:hypothetical protein
MHRPFILGFKGNFKTIDADFADFDLAVKAKIIEA